MITQARAAAALAAATVTHVLTITGADTPLDVVSASLTFDETWAPFVSATIVARGDVELLALLDPRQLQRPRIAITAGYVYDALDRETDLLADLSITSVKRSVSTGLLTITASSGEEILRRVPWPGPGAAPIPTTSVSAALRWILDRLPGNPPLTVTHDAGHFTIPDPGIEPGTALWEIASGIANDAGLWFHDTGLGWILETRDMKPDLPTALATGPAGTITEAVDGRTVDGWAQGVLVRAKWTDDAGLQQAVYATHTLVPEPTAWHIVEMTTPTTQSAATARAASTAARLAERGRGVSPVSAKAAYWLRPGHRVTLDVPGAAQQIHRAKTVTFYWPDGLMDVTTATPTTTEE